MGPSSRQMASNSGMTHPTPGAARTAHSRHRVTLFGGCQQPTSLAASHMSTGRGQFWTVFKQVWRMVGTSKATHVEQASTPVVTDSRPSPLLAAKRAHASLAGGHVHLRRRVVASLAQQAGFIRSQGPWGRGSGHTLHARHKVVRGAINQAHARLTGALLWLSSRRQAGQRMGFDSSVRVVGGSGTPGPAIVPAPLGTGGAHQAGGRVGAGCTSPTGGLGSASRAAWVGGSPFGHHARNPAFCAACKDSHKTTPCVTHTSCCMPCYNLQFLRGSGHRRHNH